MSQEQSISNTQENEENTPAMAMHLGLPPPEPLDLSGGNISANWKKFKQKYINYKIATWISSKDSAARVATLLTVIGNEAIDACFNTLIWDEEGDDKKIKKAGTVKIWRTLWNTATKDTNSSQEPKKVAKVLTST